MKNYPWLHYTSSFSDGAFCRACAFFVPVAAGGHDLGLFVTKPFRAWTKMSEKVGIHARKDYHLAALSRMEEFLNRYENPSKAVDVMLCTKLQETMDRNQSVIESLLKVVLCGKQGLALRGHRDDGINWKEESSLNEGNFIQLVRFRAETDSILAKNLAESPKNACYTSKGIQNELIDVVGNSIHSEIIAEVHQAKLYSIIADEVTDVANKEELSLVLRYFFNNEVKEVFVDFIEVMKITGEVLAKSILNWLKKNKLFVRHAWSVLRWRFQHVWCLFWLQSYCSAICPISNVLSLCLTSTKLGGCFSLHNPGLQKCRVLHRRNCPLLQLFS